MKSWTVFKTRIGRRLGQLVIFALLPVAAITQAVSAQDFRRFDSPFQGQYPLGNWHDHQLPRQFVDNDGVIVNSEGRSCSTFIDGHAGYDWLMPEGTPLYAVADGTITFAGQGASFYCPLLDSTTADLRAILAVQINGENFYVNYLHLSQPVVTQGQTVARGELIGYSGNTGCSTAPHLHFAVYREKTNGPEFSVTDPYGWNGSGSDAWLQDPEGAASENLWNTGKAPDRYFTYTLAANDCENCRAPVAITRVRWMGPNDDAVPNNEFVELTVDRRFGPARADLTGYRLKNNVGRSFSLRPVAKTAASRPISIFSGKGRNTGRKLFLNQRKGIWNDFGDCVRLVNRQGRLVYYFLTADVSCRGVNLSSRRTFGGRRIEG